MANPPTPQVRLTISVTPEVHQTFQRLAASTGISISKAMGEWLADTLEGVEFMASKMEQARSAPRQVVQELQAMSLGSADLMSELLHDLRTGKKHLPSDSGAPQSLADAKSPRSVIRGGKSPSKPSSKTRKGGKA